MTQTGQATEVGTPAAGGELQDQVVLPGLDNGEVRHTEGAQALIESIDHVLKEMIFFPHVGVEKPRVDWELAPDQDSAQQIIKITFTLGPIGAEEVQQLARLAVLKQAVRIWIEPLQLAFKLSADPTPETEANPGPGGPGANTYGTATGEVQDTKPKPRGRPKKNDGMGQPVTLENLGG